MSATSDYNASRDDSTYRPRSVSSLLMRFRAIATVLWCVSVLMWCRVRLGVGEFVFALGSRLGSRCIYIVSPNGRENEVDGGEKVAKPKTGRRVRRQTGRQANEQQEGKKKWKKDSTATTRGITLGSVGAVCVCVCTRVAAAAAAAVGQRQDRGDRDGVGGDGNKRTRVVVRVSRLEARNSVR